MYLRGVAYTKTKNFNEATEDLKAAIVLNPQDKKIRAEFENLKIEKKKAWSNMVEQEDLTHLESQGKDANLQCDEVQDAMKG